MLAVVIVFSLIYLAVFVLEDSHIWSNDEQPLRLRWPLLKVLLACLGAYAVSWITANPRETGNYNEFLRHGFQIFIGAVLLQSLSLNVEDPEQVLLGSTCAPGRIQHAAD